MSIFVERVSTVFSISLSILMLITVFSCLNGLNSLILHCIIFDTRYFIYIQKENTYSIQISIFIVLYILIIPGEILMLFGNSKKNNIYIKDKGKNNVIEIAKNIKFNPNSSILIDSDCNNCHVRIEETDCKPLMVSIQIQHGNNQSVIIKKGFKCWGGVTIKMYEAYNSLEIDEECMFADCRILCGDSHPVVSTQNKEIVNYSTGIKIGKHSWIGYGAIILKNVNIADNTIIASGSVVTKSVNEQYCVIAGNPAKIVKKGVTFDAGIIPASDKLEYLKSQNINLMH